MMVMLEPGMMVHMLLIPALGGGGETDSVHSVILRKTRDLERKKK